MRLHMAPSLFCTRNAASIHSHWHHGRGMLNSTFFHSARKSKAFQSQSARNVALFLFSTELPGTHYAAVRDVYLATATQGLLAPPAPLLMSPRMNRKTIRYPFCHLKRRLPLALCVHVCVCLRARGVPPPPGEETADRGRVSAGHRTREAAARSSTNVTFDRT